MLFKAYAAAAVLHFSCVYGEDYREKTQGFLAHAQTVYTRLYFSNVK